MVAQTDLLLLCDQVENFELVQGGAGLLVPDVVVDHRLLALLCVRVPGVAEGGALAVAVLRVRVGVGEQAVSVDALVGVLVVAGVHVEVPRHDQVIRCNVMYEESLREAASSLRSFFGDFRHLS